MSQKWALRYTYASAFHGILLAAWLSLFPLDVFGFEFNLSRIIAGGGAGMWLTVGLIVYMVTGFLGTAALGVIHYIIPNVTGKPWNNSNLILVQFVLYNVAVMGATWLLGLAGFIGGTLNLAGSPELIHGAIVVFVEPVGIFVAVGLVSVLLFLINLVLSIRGQPK
jgi:hypothetical protein